MELRTQEQMYNRSLESPALERIVVSKKRGFYPANYRGRVPMKVTTAKTVRPDLPEFHKILGITPDTVALQDQEYFVWVNSYGAVSAILPNGTELGLLPSEFDVTAWHETIPPQVQR